MSARNRVRLQQLVRALGSKSNGARTGYLHNLRTPRPAAATAPPRSRMKVFCRASYAVRDEKGHILGMRKRTPEEIVAHILANSVRDPKTGCLICNLRPDQKGYPRVGKRTRAHNAIFFDGSIPAAPRPHVLHSCDNRACVEKDHLYAGTNAQNIADKVKRDRSGKKLTIAKVRRIKTMLRQGHRQLRIAQLFGVHQTIISRINTGVRWAHVRAGG